MVDETQSHEKIKLFARLLKASIEPDLVKDINEFDNNLRILSDLSPIEFVLLKTLRKYEIKHPEEKGLNDFGNSDRYWNDFIAEIISMKILPDNEIVPSLVMLNRTGCFRSTPSPMSDKDKGHGRLTSIYYRLYNLVETSTEVI